MVEIDITDKVAGDDLRLKITMPELDESLTLVKAWATIKEVRSQADAQAIASEFITSGFTYGTPANGVKTATFSINIPATATVLCGPRRAYRYDVQVQTSDGSLNTPVLGKITFSEQVTIATS